MITVQDVEMIKKLIQLVNDNKLDSLKVGDVHLVKTKHEYKPVGGIATNKKPFNNESITEQDMLFYSTNMGPLDEEQLASLGITPPKKK